MGINWKRGRQFSLEPLFQFAPREKDVPPAGVALESDVRAQPRHRPLAAAARMRFAQAQAIIKRHFQRHEAIIAEGRVI